MLIKPLAKRRSCCRCGFLKLPNISLNTYKSFFPNASCNPGGVPTSFTPSTCSTIITAFDGHAVGHHGTCVLKLHYGGSCKSYPFHVVDANGPTILGPPTYTDLNLVTMNFNITNHKVAAGLFYHTAFFCLSCLCWSLTLMSPSAENEGFKWHSW